MGATDMVSNSEKLKCKLSAVSRLMLLHMYGVNIFSCLYKPGNVFCLTISFY
jgi:hypothetical protein